MFCCDWTPFISLTLSVLNSMTFSVQNFKFQNDCATEMDSTDPSYYSKLRCVFDGYPIFQQADNVCSSTYLQHMQQWVSESLAHILNSDHWITFTENNLGMGSANERRRYIVTSSLIGWAFRQNGPWWWGVYFVRWGVYFVRWACYEGFLLLLFQCYPGL